MTRLAPGRSLARRATHVVAAVALIVQLMLPVAAFAAVGAAGTRVPVCTGAGIVWMDVGAETPAPGTGNSDTAPVHCPMCFATAAPALAAVSASVAVPWRAATVEGAALVHTCAPCRVAWAPQQSRAPPVPA